MIESKNKTDSLFSDLETCKNQSHVVQPTCR